ncbi:flavin monoamine oxidase family protein [Vibrio sp. WXL103]|uniref:flavin monoamine oxidase family protein n=1 Tax=Vibrio sp. WXL103 TaxID=3450710 RepID=UPI003EC654CB
MKKQVTIIGAGLSGVYAGFLLEKYGITDYVILEAKDSIGGRIVDYPVFAEGEDKNSVFDLGPSWFWPEFQPDLTNLLAELDIEHYPQYELGDMLIERSANQEPTRYPAYQSAPESRRIHGGMGKIVNALANRLQSNDHILLNSAVKKVTTRTVDRLVHIECESTNSSKNFSVETEHVLFALPPRLVEESIEFTPALPDAVSSQWQATATWMAPHAKYFAIFDKPFWREQNLSGDTRSSVGPLVEIRDASIPDGKAALLGFFGVPAEVRKTVTDDELKHTCREQIIRLYGEQAVPIVDVIKDWSQDVWTSTELDAQDSGEHIQPPTALIKDGLWSNKIFGIGSEWSQKFPGYVAGAIDAAEAGVKALVKKQKLAK